MISLPPTGAAVAGGEARASASVAALSAVGVGATTQAVNEPANSQFVRQGLATKTPCACSASGCGGTTSGLPSASWARWLRRRVASRR